MKDKKYHIKVKTLWKQKNFYIIPGFLSKLWFIKGQFWWKYWYNQFWYRLLENLKLFFKRKLNSKNYTVHLLFLLICLIKEKKERSRLCIDFRKPNKIIIPQSQPFSLIEDLMFKTRDNKYFTILDINSL